MSTPSPDGALPKLGVIILGASTFPQFPADRRLDNQSFARSAEAFRNLLGSPGLSLAGTPLLLDLFDSDEPPLGIVRQIRNFLKSAPSLADVLIYYCGHGDFLPDAHKTYYLALKSTEPDNEAFTALPLRQTRLSLDLQLARKRVFLVLDCCFAGQAVTEWQSDGVGHVIEDQVFQAFPRRGTALIAASAKGLPALAPGTEPLTMFTGALVETIGEGLADRGPELSFRDVFTAARARIIDQYGQRAAIPAIHAPHQPDGDISFDPFFVNRAFVARQLEPNSAEIEYFELAAADLERPLVRTRLAALETLSELLDKTKSPSFRAQLVARLESIRDGDDSSAVRARAAALRAAAPDVGPASGQPDAPHTGPPASATEEAAAASSAPMAPEETVASPAVKAKPANAGAAKKTVVTPPAVTSPKGSGGGLGGFLKGVAALGAFLAIGWTADRMPDIQAGAVYVLDHLRGWVAGDTPADLADPYSSSATTKPKGLSLGDSLAGQPTGGSKPAGFNWDPNLSSSLLSGNNGSSSLSTPFITSPLSRDYSKLSLNSSLLAGLLGDQALYTEILPDGSKATPSAPGSVTWERSLDTSGRPEITAAAGYPSGMKLSMRAFWEPTLPLPAVGLSFFFTSASAVENILEIRLHDGLDAGTLLIGEIPPSPGPYLYFHGSGFWANAATNQQLLGSARWIDISIAYADGHRAILSLERDAAALKLFSDALASWTGTAPAAAK